MCDGFSEALLISSLVLSTATAAKSYVSQQNTASAQAKQNALQTQYIDQARQQQTQQAQQQELYHNQEAYQKE
ncbi:MAG: hypothetical protein F8N15_04905 [Methanobacterium sp.]|nr:hypothetical protein [Methanobacterium sp.]